MDHTSTWSSSRDHQNHNTCPSPIQAAIHSDGRPTTQEETEINFGPRLHVAPSISPLSFQRSHAQVSIRMTLMKMPPPRLHQRTKLQRWTPVQLQPPPCPQLPTQVHQALQLHWSLHQIPPYVSSNLLILHELPVIHRTDLGRTWTIKS